MYTYGVVQLSLRLTILLDETTAVYDILPHNGIAFDLCPVRGDVANVICVRSSTFAGVDSAIIFVDCCYSVHVENTYVR